MGAGSRLNPCPSESPAGVDLDGGLRMMSQALASGLIALVVCAGDAPAADLSTLVGRHVAGYQGWFACPSDPIDPRWSHWFLGGQKPQPTALSVDLWPDLAEFNKDELCPTGFTLSSGDPAFVFSSENAKTVRRHFQWMREYGIDGVAVQRFVGQLTSPLRLQRSDTVLRNIRVAAEAEGRGFFLMYDVTGLATDAEVATVTRDWTQLATAEHITQSPSYMRHRGKPVVGVWGLGVGDRKATPRRLPCSSASSRRKRM